MSFAKVVAMPGTNLIPAGADRRFTMDMPCSFVGKRLVVQAIDTTSGSDQLIFIRSLAHDNNELLANGRTGPVPSIAFPPPIWRRLDPAFLWGSVTTPDNPAPFHEEFDVGDIFSIVLTNQSAFPVQMLIYWFTDYGLSCGCKKGR
jgi:hypothetical protein